MKLFVAIIIVLTLVLSPAQALADELGDYNIFFLHSYNPSMVWTHDINKGVESILDSRNIAYEYMDTKEYLGDDYYNKFFEMLRYRYRDSEIDLIIVADNNALDFMVQHSSKLFPDIPLVFTGINNFQPSLVEGLEEYTGVEERIDFRENIELILQLQPEVDNIIIYGDDTTTYLANKEKFLKVAELYKDKVSITFNDDMILEDVLKEVRVLNQNEVVLLASTIKDSYGKVLSYKELSTILSKESSVPLYGVWDFFLGRGIVGGKLTGGFSQGREVARLGERILLGEEPNDIPIIKGSLNEYAFDHIWLDKFGIDKDLLPKDSIIINRLPSYWEEYNRILLPSLIAFLTLFAILIISIFHNIKLQDAKRKIDLEKDFRNDIIDTAGILVITLDLSGEIRSINEFARVVTGYDSHELIGKNFKEIFLIDEYKQIGSEETLEYFGVEKEIVTKDGEERLVSWHKSIINSSSDEESLLLTGIDITRQNRAEEALKYQENHDQLTGLLNRKALKERFELQKKVTKSRKESCIIFFVDVDRFESLNNIHGPLVGDQTLVKVGERLKNALGDKGVVARMGGDDFIGFIPTSTNFSEGFTLLNNRILNSFIEPIIVADQKFFLTVSVGVSIYPSDGLEFDILLKNASISMSQAKVDQSSSCKLYNRDMDKEFDRKFLMEGDLKRAIEEGELEVYYQPIIDLKTKRIEKAEALVRWIHPTKGIISPGKFIPLAEETGLIVPLGDYVLETSCEKIKEWVDKGYDIKQITVNLSVHQVHDRSLVDKVKEIIKRTGISTDNLGLEITESVAMKDINFTSYVLNRLKEMDINILLDDFGTGYSSLSYLSKFNIDVLKIDRSFINELPFNKKKVAITSAIIAMSEKLGIKTVAEGVETLEQLNFIQEYGCDQLQGYYFSRPVPADQFEVMLKEKKELEY